MEHSPGLSAVCGGDGYVCRSLGMHRKVGERLSGVGIFNIVRKRGKMIGFDGVKRPLLAAHDLRRTYAQLGYEGGDQAIRHVAALLKQVTRGGDLVYRYGGDEFFIVMEAQSLEMGVQVAERIRQAVEGAAVPEAIGGMGERITVSLGVASMRPAYELDDLVRAADEFLYQAKRAGRNQVVCEPCGQ